MRFGLAYWWSVFRRAVADTVHFTRGQLAVNAIVLVLVFGLFLRDQGWAGDAMLDLTLGLQALGIVLIIIFGINLVLAPMRLARDATQVHAALEVKIEAITAQLGESAQQRNISQVLSNLWNEIYEIITTTFNDDDEFHVEERKARFLEWRDKTVQFIHVNISPAKASYFVSDPFRWAHSTVYKKPIGKDRSDLMQQMKLRRERLEEIMRDY